MNQAPVAPQPYQNKQAAPEFAGKLSVPSLDTTAVLPESAVERPKE